MLELCLRRRNKITGKTIKKLKIDVFVVEEILVELVVVNFVSDSGDTGIALLGGSNNNVLRNVVKGSFFGIFLDSTSYNNVYRNIVFSNVEGISLSHSSSNWISRNIVFRNNIGIHLVDSSDNTLFSNEFFDNDEDFLDEP